MKRYTAVVLIMFLVCGAAFAQREYSQFEIRDYRDNLVIGIGSDSSTRVTLDDYGDINSQFATGDYSYLFQGQEFDRMLGVYFFPSRVYNPSEGRFYQPDPMSQYFSPYLFVSADPINIVDRNGKEGKPLILHGIEHGEMHETGMSSLPSHNYSLSDFMQDKIPDLPEWDGNVYVSAHMSPDGNIVVERANVPNRLKSANLVDEDGFNTSVSEVRNKDYMIKGGPKKFQEVQLDMEGEKFGTKLKSFSEARNVRLKNVVMAGCEGGAAAEHAADAFESAEHTGSWMGEEVNFFGAKPGNLITEFVMDNDKYVSWGFLPKGGTISDHPTGSIPFEGRTLPSYTYTMPGETQARNAIVNPHERVANEMLFNGRVTADAQQFIDHIPVGY